MAMAVSYTHLATINAQGIEVTFYKGDAYADYVSLTDIARYKSPKPKDVIKNWMRTHDVIEYLGLCETPVSYTHLDVYKRQLLPRASKEGTHHSHHNCSASTI